MNIFGCALYNLYSCFEQLFYVSLCSVEVPTKGTVKRATKNMQFVLQHCCKTSGKAMPLRVLPPTSTLSCT